MIDWYRPTMASIALRVAGAVLLASGVLACSLGAVEPLQGIMVMVSSPEKCGAFANGDLGPQDDCGRLIIIESNGLVRKATPQSANLGTLSPEVLNALKAAIEATDFQVLLDAPWEGMCADESTDRLVTYDFMTARLFACGTEIDREHALFVALAAALHSVGQPLP